MAPTPPGWKLSTKSQVFRPEALVTYAHALIGINQIILKLPFLEEPWGKVLKIENQRKDYVVGYELGQGESVSRRKRSAALVSIPLENQTGNSTTENISTYYVIDALFDFKKDK